MPALADRLFSWTVPIGGVEGREGQVRDGCENCSKVGDGGRVSREEHQFQHVVQANLLFSPYFYSPALSLPPLSPRRVLSAVL